MTAESFPSTEKIRLRTLVVEDAVYYEQLIRDDREAIFRTARMPYPCTADAVRAWFAERQATDGYVCAILAKPNDVFAGSIGMSPTGEIGYWVARKFWGRGYATDAVRCMIELARRDGIPTLHAEVFPDNVASNRVLEKAGFTQIGNVVRDLPLRGGLRELLVYERVLG